MRPRKILVTLSTLFIALTLSACAAKSAITRPSVTSSTTPTFYFHGYGGSANSTNQLIRYSVAHYAPTRSTKPWLPKAVRSP